jgi:membrane fusion protein, multidrug efflux system
MSRVWKTPWQTLFCGFFGLKAFRLLGLLGLLGTVSVVYAQGAAPVVVDAHRVSESRKTHALTLPGTLEAHEFVVIRPEVAGRLTAFHFEEGAHVHKDQVLIRLDDRLEQAAVAQAKAHVQLALSAHKRASTLSGKGFESRLVLEEAQARLAVAQA